MTRIKILTTLLAVSLLLGWGYYFYPHKKISEMKLGYTITASSTTWTTAGTYNWTVPAGVYSININLWGAGGAGGARTTAGCGGGGGGGGFASSTIIVTAGQQFTVVVGAKGTNNGTTAVQPTASTISSSTATNFVYAASGTTVAINVATGGTGAATTSSTGTLRYGGGSGRTCTTSGGGGGGSAGTGSRGNDAGAEPTGATAVTGGGNGGDGYSSTKGAGNAPTTPPGGGGGGAKRTTSGTYAGGSGSDGQAILSYVVYSNDPPAITMTSPVSGVSTSTANPTFSFTATDSAPFYDDVRYNFQLDSSVDFKSDKTKGSIVTVDYYFDGHTSVNDESNVWTNDSNGFDSSSTTAATTATGNSGGEPSSNRLIGIGTNAVSSRTETISYVEVGSSNSSGAYPILFYTLSTPSGGWTWQKVADLELRNWRYYAGVSSNVYSVYYAGVNLYSVGVGDQETGDVAVSLWQTLVKVHYYEGGAMWDLVSGTDTGFSGSPDNTDPYTQGQSVSFSTTTALSNGTYYWRVRGIDPSGSNTYGDWSASSSIIINVSAGPPPSIEPGFWIFN